MTIRIGLIGCGEIARWHVDGYLQIPSEARVTAVSDVMAANAQKMAQYVGGARIYSDYHDLVDDRELDAVDICLPHHLHTDAIIAAARAGKHILCEKPLCLTVEEAERIRLTVQESGVTLMCAHNQLFDPPIRKAKELLAAGSLGRIYEIRTVDIYRQRWNTVAEMGWRSKKEMSGGGELLDTGYHPTYMLLYLAESFPVEVAAILSRHRLHFMEGEDSAQVLVQFADGTVGNIVTSWAYDRIVGGWPFQVMCENGQVYGDRSTLYVKRSRQEIETTPMAAGINYHAEVQDFVACLRFSRKPIQTEADGINVLKVILGAYRSVAEKRFIPLV